MKTINELIDFINESNLSLSHSHRWNFNKCKDFLDKNFKNWEVLVGDASNWEIIEKINHEHAFTFFSVFIDSIGSQLANYGFFSKNEKMKIATHMWIERLFEEGKLTPEIWTNLIKEIKEYLIKRVFDLYPGEPIQSLKGAFKNPDNNKILSICGFGYEPSNEIKELRSFVQIAEKQGYLKIIDDNIKHNENIWGNASNKTFYRLYIPTKDEYELIARVLDKFRRNNFYSLSLPTIYLSFELPPLFIAYPGIEHKYKKEQNGSERRIPINERGEPEIFNIEEILGFYKTIPQIIIYQKGIEWLANKYNYSIELLRAVVLIHEIGHWVSHLLPSNKTRLWPTFYYEKTSSEMHETLAQLITWWVVSDIGGDIKQTFENLNKTQSQVYHIFRNFIHDSEDSVINSINELRKQTEPIDIDSWKAILRK